MGFAFGRSSGLFGPIGPRATRGLCRASAGGPRTVGSGASIVISVRRWPARSWRSLKGSSSRVIRSDGSRLGLAYGSRSGGVTSGCFNCASGGRFGELIQIDGSPHDWFEGRGPRCTLIVFIDDATARLTALRFAPTETTRTYLGALKDHVLAHGCPAGFYSDRQGIFRVNAKDAVSGDGKTELGRVCERLRIELINALTPQAKGRVERANQTLQDRLVREMRHRGISSIEEAQAFTPAFIAAWNEKFAVPPRDSQNAHRPWTKDADALEEALARREERVRKGVDNGWGRYGAIESARRPPVTHPHSTGPPNGTFLLSAITGHFYFALISNSVDMDPIRRRPLSRRSRQSLLRGPRWFAASPNSSGGSWWRRHGSAASTPSAGRGRRSRC